MLLWLQALIQGIVEGITEFLPISSTGHLIISGELMHFPKDFALKFDIIIQLGAILAVVVHYWSRIWKSLSNLKPGKWGFNLWRNVVVAFIPAAVVGILTKEKIIDKYLFSSFTVAIALIVGAVMMLAAQRVFVRSRNDNIDTMGVREAVIIGLAQILSLFPGFSRSASTIMGGMASGMTVRASAEFSFFLALPVMFAATLFSLKDGIGSMSGNEWIALGIGFAVSFVVAKLVISKFLDFLSRHALTVFAWYRLAVGVVMLVLVTLGIVAG